MSFAVSTARIDITPTVMTEMAGYGCVSTPRRATGTYSPLHATAVVLWDDGSPNVIISMDVEGIPAAWHQALRPRLVALASWASSDIVLIGTHTHNAPMAPDAPDPYILYNATDMTACNTHWAQLSDNIVALVTAALAAPRVTVTLDYQFATQNWSFNRAGLSYTETDVPVLTARKPDGLPAVIFFSYGTHPVTAGQQTLWDGDFPSAAVAVIEAAIPGCVAAFLPGPAGDQDPVYPRSWAERNRHGASLGQAVVQKASAAGRAVTGPLMTSLSSVTAPLMLPTTPAEWATLRASYVARLTNPPHGDAWAVRHAQRMIAAIDAGSGWATSITLPTQVWKLSGSPTLRLGFVAGELTSGYGVLFRNRFNGTNGLYIGGYANECVCYTVADTFFPPYDTNGSYEGGWDTDAPNAGGGSMGIYGFMGHFRYYPQAGALEGLLVAALTTQLT